MTITTHSLETERLILRLPKNDDTPEIAKMHADPEIMSMAGCSPLSPQENSDYCRKNLEQWQIKSYGMYFLEEKETGDFCGLVGLRPCEKTSIPELGWILLKSKWGKGLALEAARAVKDHAFQNLGITEIHHYIDPHNTRSIRLVEKLGATRDKEILRLCDDLERVSDILYITKKQTS